MPADAARAVSQPVKFALLDKMLPQPANRVIVGLSAPTRKFRVGDAVMLRLHVKNANDEIKGASGVIELDPESGEYHLMRTSANAVRQDKLDAGAVQVWELVIPADARIDVWPRHPTSSMGSPPITGLPTGVYRVRWFGYHTPMGSKYRTGDVDIIVK